MSKLLQIVGEQHLQFVDISRRGDLDDQVAVDSWLAGVKKTIQSEATDLEINHLLETNAKSRGLLIPATGLFVADQGYLGKIAIKDGEVVSIELASAFGGKLKAVDQDPVAKEFGGPNVWMTFVKGARGLLIPEGVSAEQTAVDRGLTLGWNRSSVDSDGSFSLFGTTSFMPNEDGLVILNGVPGGTEHLESEKAKAFRGSGWADQLAANEAAGIVAAPETFARDTRNINANWN